MEIQSIGVVGAGQMGSGIAQVAAQSGYQVLLLDVSDSAVEKSKNSIKNSLEKLEQKGLLKGASSVFERLHFGTEFQKLKGCQLLIEAIVENEDAKKKVLAEMDGLLPKDALMASNTSSLSITRLAQATKRAEQFIGMHFMNPVPLMKLVEVIRGHRTSDATTQMICDLAKQMGKVTTISKDYPGFIANRLLMPMINEAFYVLMEGVATAEDIDTTMKLGMNHPMGPLTLGDFIGLDTCLAIMEVLHQGLGDPKYRPCPMLRQYVDSGLYGRKTKRGVFVYS